MTDKPLVDEEMLGYILKLAAIKNRSPREILRGAIATEFYLQQRLSEGFRVLIENGKEIREVIFK